MSTDAPLWVSQTDRPSRIYTLDKEEVVSLLEEHNGEALINTLRRESRLNESRIRAALEVLHEEGRVEITELRRNRVRRVRLDAGRSE